MAPDRPPTAELSRLHGHQDGNRNCQGRHKPAAPTTVPMPRAHDRTSNVGPAEFAQNTVAPASYGVQDAQASTAAARCSIWDMGVVPLQQNDVHLPVFSASGASRSPSAPESRSSQWHSSRSNKQSCNPELPHSLVPSISAAPCETPPTAEDISNTRSPEQLIDSVATKPVQSHASAGKASPHASTPPGLLRHLPRPSSTVSPTPEPRAPSWHDFGAACSQTRKDATAVDPAWGTRWCRLQPDIGEHTAAPGQRFQGNADTCVTPRSNPGAQQGQTAGGADAQRGLPMAKHHVDEKHQRHTAQAPQV